VATHGEEVVLGGQSRPPRERGPSASNKFFAGFLSIYAYTLYPRIPVPVLPNFGVLLYLTQNDQIQNGNTYGSGEGRVLGSSAMSLHLHKCVARFVSDW